MCTVTLVPLSETNFVLISNRDEAPNRNSLAPDFYNYKGLELLYPKDEQSEGSWIGMSEKKRLICLLNGGFEIHQRQSKYRMSRGLVVKDLLVSNAITQDVEAYNLIGIEPFTMVIVEWQDGLKFYELVWDGSKKYFQRLPLSPKIWSSSTLYNKEMRAERQKWFDDYKKDNLLNPYSLFVFHQIAGKDNMEYGVIMDRGFVKTTSITRIEKDDDTVFMRYYDLSSQSHHVKSMNEASRVHE